MTVDIFGGCEIRVCFDVDGYDVDVSHGRHKKRGCRRRLPSLEIVGAVLGACRFNAADLRRNLAWRSVARP